MNNETGNSCPMPSCPDNYGAMPPAPGWQSPMYLFSRPAPSNIPRMTRSATEPVSRPEPAFHLKVEGSALPSTPLVELQALEFVVLELGTYLDTHPDDMEAFELFKQYSAMEQSAKRL